MWLLKCLEWCLGRLLFRRRGYDAQCFFNLPAFKEHPKPTIPIESPDCGASGGKLSLEYSKFGSGRVPSLTWPPATPDIKEYLLLAEDPDAPLGHPNVHGIYCFILPTANSFSPSDLEVIKEENGVKEVKSGWRVGKNRRNLVYILPRPPRGHGPHRYFFELVALNEKLDPETLGTVPTKEEVAKVIEGKVVSWGMWEATFEAPW